MDVKNKFPVLTVIADLVGSLGTAISSALDNIKYWYKCQGGKEKVAFGMSIVGAIVALALAVVSFPASGFFAICAAISACITAVNSLVNIYTSWKSLKAAESRDPAWAKIYGDQDKLTDVMRATNFNDGLMNKLSYVGADVIDTTQLFCDFMGIVELAGKIRVFPSAIKNFFSSKTGLLSYMKTVKWKNVGGLDNAQNAIKVIDAENGVAKTEYTFESVMRGIKAFKHDAPIDAHSEQGIRTLLSSNFKTDMKSAVKTIFKPSGWKDTVKYAVTDGNRITFAELKNSLKPSSLVDSCKSYTAKNIKGMFTEGLKWTERRNYIKNTANGVKSCMNVTQDIIDFAVGDFDANKSFVHVAKNHSDGIKLGDKISKFTEDGCELLDNLYLKKVLVTQ